MTGVQTCALPIWLGAIPTIPRTTGTSTAVPRSTTTPSPYLTPGIEAPATFGKSTMSGRVASKTIAYPFQILAWEEDNGAPTPPKPPADQDDPTAPPPPSK